MIKIGLVTNWETQCGISEYARNLVMHMRDPEIEFRIIHQPLTFERIMEQTRDVDIIHINFAYYLFKHLTTRQYWQMRVGRKMVLTYHESSPEQIRRWQTLGGIDKVIVHEKHPDGKFRSDMCMIPQGIKMPDVFYQRPEMKIGTAGFPFRWKGFDAAAVVAQKLGLGYLAIMSQPDSDNLDVLKQAREVLTICPSAEVLVGWSDHDRIVRQLLECCMTVFPYDEIGLYGISAAVRFGLATMRPLVVSRSLRFRDLFDYEDEVYFIDKGLDHTVVEVLKDIEDGCAKIPNRIINDMNWDRCAQMYADVYKEIANAARVADGGALQVLHE